MLFLLTGVVIAGVWFNGKHYRNTLAYYQNLYHSKSLPYSIEAFIGRENEMKEVIELVDFDNSKLRIVSIVGPPGIGKSTLAIHVGHDMVAQGVVVYHVDMVEVSSMQSLAEKVLDGDETLVSTKNVTIDRLIKWARDLHHRTLLILDNCDDILHRQKETLQKMVKRLLGSSNELKIMMTSRQRAMQLSQFKMYALRELSVEASCDLLQIVTGQLNSTLCESIANLTGNVPLALQVVGALLNQPDPPDPMTIIHNLEKQLISTLSPEGLLPEERVNASIDLSYQYLDEKLQKFGRYFANFPGSFSEETTYEIMRSFAQNPITCSYISTSLHKLVQRSLLEYNQRSGRYQFHRLIREFFLDIQRSTGKSGYGEVVRFSKGFRQYYANKLMHLSKQFRIDHKAALSTFDIERHNIQHFLDEFEASRTINDADYLSMVRAVVAALDTRYLICRFTPQEMLGPLQAILIRIDNKLRPVSPRKDMATYTGLYISIVMGLAKLEEELNGTQTALQTILAHKQTVERMESYDFVSDLDYAKFYIQLSIYHATLDEHDGVRQCQARILKKTENELEHCSVKSCSYFDIGTAYYFIDSHEDSIHFLQLALKTQALSTITRAVSIHRLLKSYQAISDHDMAQATLEDFIAVFPSLMSAPEAELFKYNNLLQEIITGFRDNGRTEEAFALEEQQIEVIQEFGAKPSLETVIKIRDLVVHLFLQQNYSKAADLAIFGMESLKQLTEEQRTHRLRLHLQILIAFVKWNTGRLSEALDDAEHVVDFIYEYEQGPSVFPIELSKVCEYVAVFRLRYGCVIGDHDIGEIVISGGIKLVVAIFEVLLDVSKEPDVSQGDAQIIQLSQSKALSVKTDELTLYTAWLNSSSLLLHSGHKYAFGILSANVRWFVQFKVIRFLINVLWITVKLTLAYYILCCRCIPCKAVVIAIGVDLCVCLIATYLLNVAL